jgi:hypothetical protein
MMLSKITSAISIEVNLPKKRLESAVNWLVQVVCAEHQVCFNNFLLNLFRLLNSLWQLSRASFVQ